MAFVADDLGAWMVGVLADAGRARVTELILGTEQERALRQAAATAVRLTAEEVRPDNVEEAAQVAAVISQVFSDPTTSASLPKGVTLLEGLESGIAGQLAVLDDASLTGTGSSSAEALGIDAGWIAENLTGHLVQQIMMRGARGGPLFPLASLLSQNVTQLQGQRLQDAVGRLVQEVSEMRARLGSDRLEARAQPRKVYVQYVLTLDGELEFDADAWVNAFSNERTRMVEEAVAERLDIDFDAYGGQGIAECIDGGELNFTESTDAERRAQWDAEVIESASRVYAGIGDYDEWPTDVPRPSATSSYTVTHEGVEYVILRNQDKTVAVFDVDGGGFKRLKAWPHEIESR
jgi:hypothetical protein